MKLLDVWQQVWPLFRERALLEQQLPGYRDWRHPLRLLDREIGGLSLLFFHKEPLYQHFLAETQMTGPKRLVPLEPPRGTFVGFGGDAEVAGVPLYRRVGVKGLVPSSEFSARPTCTWSEWIAALGYTIEIGPTHAIAGKRIVLPRRDPVDHAAEAMRTVAHLEWQASNQTGYLGGEFLFLMLAPHFRLDATGLRAPRVLVDEIEHADPKTVTETSLRAAALAAERLEALGPEHVRAYVDALETPMPQQDLFNFLGGDR